MIVDVPRLKLSEGFYYNENLDIIGLLEKRRTEYEFTFYWDFPQGVEIIFPVGFDIEGFGWVWLDETESDEMERN